MNGPRPKQSLEGKVALVTGGTRGIGRAIALRMAEERMAVCVTGRDAGRGAETVAEIEARGAKALYLPHDVTDYAGTQAVMAKAETALGPIDVLVANAGIGTVGFVADSDPEEWRAMMDVNFFGTVHAIRALLPGMIARKRGSIVAIASVAATTGWPEWAGYCASKFAVVGFLECLGREMVDKGVRISVVNPGSVDTPFWDDLNQDLHRAGTESRGAMMTAEDVAEIVMLQLRLPQTVLMKSTVTFPANEWH